jgi:bifunctional non-homologous end joining protein LigD
MPPTDVRPAFVMPMKAVLTPEAPAGPGWVFERKLDGIRCLALKEGGRTRLYSRNELSLNDRYAPPAAALDADPPDSFVVDGEAVALVGGRGRFGGGEGGELFYSAFDVPFADGRDVRALPLEARRAVLEGRVRWRDLLHLTEQLTGDGAALLADACRDGWEGLIATRPGTPHGSTRSRDWPKLKCTRAQELVIGGFTAPRGSRTELGALLAGHFEGHRLGYAGKVGTGFTRATLRELSERLAPLVRDTSPFEPEKGIPRAATWVEAKLVAQIAFMECTADGRLRHPSFLGMRLDKPAREVTREAPERPPRRTGPFSREEWRSLLRSRLACVAAGTTSMLAGAFRRGCRESRAGGLPRWLPQRWTQRRVASRPDTRRTPLAHGASRRLDAGTSGCGWRFLHRP